MKTTLYILTVLFTMQSSILFAGNPDLGPHPASPAMKLAPVPPREATFEETIEILDLSAYKPVTPMEADFTEYLPVNQDSIRIATSNRKIMAKPRVSNPSHLTLIIPTEADFE
jgi:hypothetical protein